MLDRKRRWEELFPAVQVVHVQNFTQLPSENPLSWRPHLWDVSKQNWLFQVPLNLGKNGKE